MEEQVVSDERAVTVIEQAPLASGVAGPRSRSTALIRPVASAEEVLAAWQQFQELKHSLLTLDDYQEVQGRARIKKSGWRKIAAAFGISDRILREERRDSDGPGGKQFVWEITVRAIAPNGRFADAVGSCASNERRFAHVDHDVRAVAHTRGKNRAVADLVGGGEVSAEELEGLLPDALPARTAGQRPTPIGAPTALSGAAAAAAQPLPDDGATDAQLRAIRAHLRRTGIDEARACAKAGVESLDTLTRRAAADLLNALSRQPNVA